MVDPAVAIKVNNMKAEVEELNKFADATEVELID